MQDETQIRTLIERWIRAVQERDLEGVLADHTDDIVMYDVPPPENGARGIDEYRETWPQFFQWLEQGGMFELTSLDASSWVNGAPTSLAALRGSPVILEIWSPS